MTHKDCTFQFLEQQESDTIRAVARVGKDTFPLFFRATGSSLRPSTEALAGLCLLPAAKRGGAIAFDGTISTRWAASMPRLIKQYQQWSPSLSVPELRCESLVPVPDAKSDRVGVFFTGGVDSWYTLLEKRDEITDLIYVHGFDLRLEQAGMRRQVSRLVQEVGAQMGVQVVEVETNARNLLRDLSWHDCAHGAALACIGHLLQQPLSRCYISASYSDGYSEAHATGPELDPLWGTEQLEFIHFGYETRRIDKVARISQHDAALQHLRVCWVNNTSRLNCGRCEKCIRTMLSLRAHDALGRCTTFEQGLSPKHIEKLFIRPIAHDWALDNLRVLREKPGCEDLCVALQRVMNKPNWLVRLNHRKVRVLFWAVKRIRRYPVLNRWLKRAQEHLMKRRAIEKGKTIRT